MAWRSGPSLSVRPRGAATRVFSGSRILPIRPCYRVSHAPQKRPILHHMTDHLEYPVYKAICELRDAVNQLPSSVLQTKIIALIHDVEKSASDQVQEIKQITCELAARPVSSMMPLLRRMLKIRMKLARAKRERNLLSRKLAKLTESRNGHTFESLQKMWENAHIELAKATSKLNELRRSTESRPGYKHPTSIDEFEALYRKEYEQELSSCDSWIQWCEKENDAYGTNFHQGLRSSLVFNNIKMGQLIRILKQEHPNKAACYTPSSGGS
jgi:hypothetical protein